MATVNPFATPATPPDKYHVEANARKKDLALIIATSTVRTLEEMPTYQAYVDASQEVGAGVDQETRQKFEDSYNKIRMEQEVQGQAKVNNIQVDMWLANASADDKKGKLKPFPAMPPNLTAYLGTITI